MYFLKNTKFVNLKKFKYFNYKNNSEKNILKPQSDKAIFLDRDGTITKDNNYINTINNFAFINSIQGLKKLYLNGYKLIIISNQSVARELITVKDVKEFNSKLIEELKKNSIFITQIYVSYSKTIIHHLENRITDFWK